MHSSLQVVAAFLVLAAVVVFVVAPLLRAADPAGEPAAVPAVADAERRERALAALRELEFDHRTGKVTDGDYAAALGPLRAEAAAALQAVGRG